MTKCTSDTSASFNCEQCYLKMMYILLIIIIFNINISFHSESSNNMS